MESEIRFRQADACVHVERLAKRLEERRRLFETASSGRPIAKVREAAFTLQLRQASIAEGDFPSKRLVLRRISSKGFEVLGASPDEQLACGERARQAHDRLVKLAEHGRRETLHGVELALRA